MSNDGAWQYLWGNAISHDGLIMTYMQDLAEFADVLWKGVVSNNISLIISASIVFFLSMEYLYRIIKSKRLFQPSIFTIIGMLGTFIGIFIGLSEFDLGDINSSIPKLIEGLKLSFSTSIIGIMASLFAKTTFFLKKTETSNEFELFKTLVDNSAEQIRLTKVSNEKLDQFAQNISNQTTDVMIEALQDVVTDFNKNITEQFGENFKQLNESIDNLLIWQNNYKNHIEKIESGIKILLKQFSEIHSRLEEIPLTLAPIDEILTNLQTLIQVYHPQLEAIRKLKEDTENAFPIINENIDALTTRLTQSLKENFLIIGEAQKNVETSSHMLKQSYDDISISLKETTSDVSTSLKKAGEETQKQITENWERTDQAIRNVQDNFHEEVQKELEQALSLFAQKLAQISEKFADDYSPIADKLNEIINATRIRS